MNKLSAIFKIASNKYVLAVVIFVVWISFFDRNDLFTQWDRKQELNKLETSASFYESEIITTKNDLTNLTNNSATLEKFAREKFYLKRQNEEIFIVVSDSAEKK